MTEMWKGRASWRLCLLLASLFVSVLSNVLFIWGWVLKNSTTTTITGVLDTAWLGTLAEAEARVVRPTSDEEQEQTSTPPTVEKQAASSLNSLSRSNSSKTSAMTSIAKTHDQRQNAPITQIPQRPQASMRGKTLTRAEYYSRVRASPEARVNSSLSSSSSPRPSTSAMWGAFGACLLVNDENHRLPEWLAYHYYMLPLRHVILMVDPRSETSPMPIVERWKPFMHTFEVWSDADLEYDPPNRTDWYGRIMNHQKRQKKFYYQCVHALRKRQLGWVAFHDVDEAIYLDPSVVPDALERMRQPGSVLKFINQMRRPQARSLWPQLDSRKVQRLDKYGQEIHQRFCIVPMRTLFGGVELNATEVAETQAAAPRSFNATDFETLRWQYRTLHSDLTNNGPGKSLVHVSGPKQIHVLKRGPHVVVKSCGIPNSASFSPIRIRHYMGSWEVYSSRDDPRRSVERYEYRSQFMGRKNRDTDVVPWLSGFCHQVGGNEQCRYLLQGVGQLPPRSDSVQNRDWHLTPERMQQEISEERTRSSRMRVGQFRGSSFGQWLTFRFNVTTLANGTILATRRTLPQQHYFSR